MYCFDIVLFFRDLSEMITGLRREHLKRDTFLFIVKRDHVLQDALRRMQKPTFRVDLEMMVGSVLLYCCPLRVYTSIFQVSFIGEDGMTVEGLLENFSLCCQKQF